MRHVFSDRSMIAHLWAHQLQEDARDSYSHFFFEGNVIYSYGYHFPCGQIVANQDGNRAYVLNANSYSNTTAKHQICVRRAIPTGAKVFTVPGCESPIHAYGIKYVENYTAALNGVFYYLLQIENFINAQYRARTRDYTFLIKDCLFELRDWVEFWKMNKSQRWAGGIGAKTYTTRKSIHDLFSNKRVITTLTKNFKLNFKAEQIVEAIEIYNTLKYFGLMADELPHDMGFSLDAAIGGVVNQYLKSDLFEKIEKAQKEERLAQKKLKAEREKKQIEGDLRRLEEWHSYKTYSWYPSEAFEKKMGWHTALKVSEDEDQDVRTSKGITISKDEARRLWKIIKVFHVKGTFTHQLAVDTYGTKWKFNSYENDVLIAGCHKIPYSEMERVAKQLHFD